MSFSNVSHLGFGSPVATRLPASHVNIPILTRGVIGCMYTFIVRFWRLLPHRDTECSFDGAAVANRVVLQMRGSPGSLEWHQPWLHRKPSGRPCGIAGWSRCLE